MVDSHLVLSLWPLIINSWWWKSNFQTCQPSTIKWTNIARHITGLVFTRLQGKMISKRQCLTFWKWPQYANSLVQCKKPVKTLHSAISRVYAI
jgi:hypothetical protein